jgi:hypothetical protein
MTIFKWLFLLAIPLCLGAAFTNPSPAGTYSVYKDDAQQQILEQLILRPDNTFSYIDHSNPSKMLDISGQWTYHKGAIHLNAGNEKPSFRNKWRFNAKKLSIYSRKGLEFRRLCQVQ